MGGGEREEEERAWRGGKRRGEVKGKGKEKMDWDSLAAKAGIVAAVDRFFMPQAYICL